MSAESVLWILVCLLALAVLSLSFSVHRLMRSADDAADELAQWRNYALSLEPYAGPSIDERWGQGTAELGGLGSDWSNSDTTVLDVIT